MNKEKIINIIKFKEKESYFLYTGIVLIGFLGTSIYKTSTLEEKIYNGVSIGQISVGGLDTSLALSNVENFYKGLSDKTALILNINNETVNISFNDLGISFNIEEMIDDAISAGKKDNLILSTLSRYGMYISPHTIKTKYTIDEEKLSKFVNELIEQYCHEAINVQYQFGESSIEIIEKEKNGYLVSHENLTSYLKNGIINAINRLDTPIETTYNDGSVANENPEFIPEEVTVEGEITTPKLTEDVVSKMTIIGSYSSQLPSTTNGRGKNVKLYSSKLNNYILMPNEEFSVTEAGGEIELSTGYYYATTFINGEPVDSVGGGVCQVVSTLYNAILYADLEVTERHQHSLTVGYVPLGRDATMYPGLKDLRFVNNTEHPLILEVYVTDSGKVVTNIWGIDPNPNKSIELSVKTLGPLYVETYKHTYENGILVNTEVLHRDKYKK